MVTSCNHKAPFPEGVFIPEDADILWYAPDSDTLLSEWMDPVRNTLPAWQDWKTKGSLESTEPGLLVRLNFANPIWMYIVRRPNYQPPTSLQITRYLDQEVLQLSDELFLVVLDEFVLVSDHALTLEKAIYQYGTSRVMEGIPPSIDPEKSWCRTSLFGGRAVYWQTMPGREKSVVSFAGFCEESPEQPGPGWHLLEQILPAGTTQVKHSTRKGSFPDGLVVDANGTMYIVLPDLNGLLSAYDVLARQTYLQFELRQLLMPAPLTDQKANPWVTALEDFLLIAERPEDLHRWIDQYLSSTTILADSGREELFRELSEGSQAVLFEQSSGYLRLVGRKGTNWEGVLSRQTKEAFVRITQTYSHSNEIRWFNRIAGPGDECFYLQDDDYKMTILGPDMTNRWSISLKAKVLGVWWIPPSSNRERSRLLVQTPDRLLLLDEEGNLINPDVWPFPVPANCQAAVIRFEKMGQTNIFLPLSNGMLYGLDGEGRLLPGWGEGIDSTVLDYSPGHFAWEQGDYLFALDTAGILRVFNRKGTLRFPKIQGGHQAVAPPFCGAGPSGPRIVWLQDNGSLKVVNTQGSSFGLSVGARLPVKDFYLTASDPENPDYLILDSASVIRSGYDGTSFGIREQLLCPASCTDLKVDPDSGDILGCWSESEMRYYLHLDGTFQQSIPFNGPPVVFGPPDAQRIVGPIGQEIRVYLVQ